MANCQEPNWQPISSLSMITGMIDPQVAEAQNQYANLLEASKKPYVLDYTIQRVIKVFKEQQEFLWIYEKQLSKWEKEETLSIAQQREITRLKEQVKEWGKSTTDILSLTDEFIKPK